MELLILIPIVIGKLIYDHYTLRRAERYARTHTRYGRYFDVKEPSDGGSGGSGN